MYSPTTIAAVLAGTLAWALPVTTAQAQVDPRLWGLSMIGVDKAWAQGFDGRGIAVGVMDDAAQVDHPNMPIAGRPASMSMARPMVPWAAIFTAPM